MKLYAKYPIFEAVLNENVSQMEQKELVRVYETLLITPGMNDVVKLDLKISRKLVLLLSQVVEKGIREEDTGLNAVDKEASKELKQVMGDCLEKAGLTGLIGKLKEMTSS